MFCCVVVSHSLAAETWEMTLPGGAHINQKVYVNTEYLELHVPKTFEGRTAKEWRTNFGVELHHRVRYERQQAEVELRGSATVFDFEYTADVFDVQLFESKQTRPGSNSCMDCHGGDFARTRVTAGYTKKYIDPKPYRRGRATIYLTDARSDSWNSEVNHWIAPKLMVKGKLEKGKIEQGRYNLSAQAITLGLAGMPTHRLSWSGDMVFSHVETYSHRKTFVGKLNYRLLKGLKFQISGGIFLDGYTKFGTRVAEMGMMTTTMEKDDSALLPNLFNRLKDDKFGYMHYNIGYEHRF